MASAEPLRSPEAREHLRACLSGGSIESTRHALREMKADGLSAAQVEHVLRAGVVEEAEWEGGEWRYRVRSPQLAVIVAFESESLVVVVTGWRFK